MEFVTHKDEDLKVNEHAIDFPSLKVSVNKYLYLWEEMPSERNTGYSRKGLGNGSCFSTSYN